jgi:HAD superfamily hydrolase (TIGR01509 family)
MLQAVIFDMDGLLLDSERIALRAWEGAAAQLKLSLPEEVVKSTIGRDWVDTKRIVAEAVGINADYIALQSLVQVLYRKIMQEEGIPLKAGAAELLKRLQDAGIPSGLATSSERNGAECKLYAAGLLGLFSGSACGNEVAMGKPNPDIYLLAAQRCGVQPQLCVALEDSPAGLMAAKRAGMTTIMVPDMVEPDEASLKFTDYVVKDLFEAGDLILQKLIN